jgi:hypothetical protein
MVWAGNLNRYEGSSNRLVKTTLAPYTPPRTRERNNKLLASPMIGTHHASRRCYLWLFWLGPILLNKIKQRATVCENAFSSSTETRHSHEQEAFSTRSGSLPASLVHNERLS